jgi:hypothetical protein
MRERGAATQQPAAAKAWCIIMLRCVSTEHSSTIQPFAQCPASRLPPTRAFSQHFSRRVTVWEWTGSAADEGDAAAAWLSAFLGRPARLVRYLGTLDPTARDAAAALAAEAVVGGGGPAGAEGAAAGLARAVDPQFVPWGAEVAFAGALQGWQAAFVRVRGAWRRNRGWPGTA